ncbi:MAG: glycosyltransferase family 4 protein [Acidimicrobiales bacterium]
MEDPPEDPPQGPADGPPVLHVLEALRGGTARHVVDAVRATAGFRHHVAVPPSRRRAESSGAPLDEGSRQDLVDAGAKLHMIDMRRSPVHPANAMASAQIRRLSRHIEAVVLHGHSSVGGALARLAATGTGLPAIYTPNGLAAGGLALGVERILGPLTARLIAVSESEADQARRLRLIPPDRLVVIPNGIDLTSARPDRDLEQCRDLRSEFGLAPGTPLVGTVARLVAQKSPEDFVAACAAVAGLRPDVHFLLIGMGPLQPAVDGAIRGAGIGDRFHQIRHLPGAAAVLGQLDVFVLASRFEGAPYTPLEAMRAGVPVVLSDVVGNRDAVLPGRTGELVPFARPDLMGAAVAALLASPARQAALVAAARVRLAERFDIRRMGAALGALYDEVRSR